MDNRALLDAIEGIDDALVRRAEADRTGTGLKRTGVLRRAIPVLSAVLLLAAGIAAGVIIAQKTKQHAQPGYSGNNAPIGSNGTAEPGGTDELQPTAEPEDPLTPEEVLLALDSFLNDEGFDGELNYEKFHNILARYSIDGISVMDFSDGNNEHYFCQFDGEDYCGWEMAFTGSFYARAESFLSENVHDEFYVGMTAPAEGLELPFGIEFGDPLPVVFQKMGITVDLTGWPDNAIAYKSGMPEQLSYLPVAKTDNMNLYLRRLYNDQSGLCDYSLIFRSIFESDPTYVEVNRYLYLVFDSQITPDSTWGSTVLTGVKIDQLCIYSTSYGYDPLQP
jgi:hypothetical protein